MMKKLFFLIAAVLCCMNTSAQSAREEIDANPFLCGSNYLDYDRQLSTTPLTPAPKGYEPFYMSHYGRHGSRWLIGENDYDAPLRTLRTARRYGKLTALGEEVLHQFEQLYKTTINRRGELTTVGERQHHGIAKRMVDHFPELFKAKGLNIDARSTTVIRCILSMEAECEELAQANPTACFHNDVSESLQYYLNAPLSDQLRASRNKGDSIREVYKYRLTHPQRLMRQLFNDEQWVYDNVAAGDLMRQLFQVACNMQSHDTDIDFLRLFTPEERFDLWSLYNIRWYISYGPANETDGLMPFRQAELLRNIIQTADTIISPITPAPSPLSSKSAWATLRFGHEVCVMPLACLLELGDCGKAVDDLDHLSDTWRNYRIFPMASNIQLVFYRPRKGTGDILVKALLNEREVSLPAKTDQWPYYRWADLRTYYLKKLEGY